MIKLKHMFVGGALVTLSAPNPATGAGVKHHWNRTILPIAPIPYTNTIRESYKDSIPQIHPLVMPPKRAPNVLLILIDDAGYAQTGTFGAPIPTPTLDRLAAGGLRYINFHVTAVCSASRASLLTGRNHHAVGMGVVAESSTGYPGYDGTIPRSAAFISEILRENGYATAAIGKWHLAPNWELTPTGPFNHWPTSEGFEYYYGFLRGSSDQWNPELYEGTHPTTMKVPPGRKDNYTLNEDLADKAIAWIQREKSATPDRPFFLYYAPGATHSPLQVPKEWIEKFKGKFNMGWDRYREIVFKRQKELGVIPADAELTPRPKELPAWDSLSPDQKKVSERIMEVFAGYMAQTDYEIGRIVHAIASIGQLHNTLIIFIGGDNGASMDGGLSGSFNIQAQGRGKHLTTSQMLARLNELGSAASYPLYPSAWGWAGNTPFQWGKHIASHFGGTTDPLVIFWPDRIKDKGGVRSQFHHLIDIAPTILEAAHLPEPVSVDGAKQMPIEGVSMVYTFDHPAAPSRRRTQYFEIEANRAIYHDGWVAAARSGRLPWIWTGSPDFEKQPWELYHVSKDYSERWNLAKQYPDRLAGLKALFTEEAWKYHVFPLDPRRGERHSPLLRPSIHPNHTTYTYYTAPIHLFNNGAAPDTDYRSFTIKAKIAVSRNGSDGVIAATGGRFGGYALFVKDDRAHFTYNYDGLEMTKLSSSERLPTGAVTIDFRFNYDGGGIHKGGTAILDVNGKTVAEKRIPRTEAFSNMIEAFNIGQDTGTAVGDYVSPFRFRGQITKVTFNIEPRHFTKTEQMTFDEETDALASIRQ